MKRTLRRILSLAAVLVLVMSLAAPAFAAGTVTPVAGTQTVYRTMKSSTEYGMDTVNITLANGTKNFTIKRADVKVTANGTGAKMVGFDKNYNTYGYKHEYNYSGSSAWQSYQHSDANYHYTAELQVTKSGTASVSYKIGSKTYKTSVKILPYTNPIKSITLTGVNGGKTFASLTKNQLSPSKNLTLKTTTKNAKLAVTPAKGWKITSVSVDDYTDNVYRSISSWEKGMSSVTLPCGTLNKAHNYSVDVELRNSSNGATMNIWYKVHGASAPNIAGG